MVCTKDAGQWLWCVLGSLESEKGTRFSQSFFGFCYQLSLEGFCVRDSLSVGLLEGPLGVKGFCERGPVLEGPLEPNRTLRIFKRVSLEQLVRHLQTRH